MRSVYLVRHGAYDRTRNILPGRLPLPLSAEGIEQARKMAAFFAEKSIQTIYASQVLRCKQTAEIISDGRIPVVYDRRLLEVLSACQGYWSTTEDAWFRFNRTYSHMEDLGGESYADVQRRMLSFFNEVIAPGSGNSIICSHGDPLQLLSMGLANIPYPAEAKLLDAEFPDAYLPQAGMRQILIRGEGSYDFLPIVRFGSRI